MNSTILTARQKLFLDIMEHDSSMSEAFYLSGGTALAGFYIPYRYSEDLDFFSQEEIDAEAIAVFLKKNKPKLGFQAIDSSVHYNRNLFFLKYNDDVLKTEFTYFPFAQIEKPMKQNGIMIDSIIDIAVNKVFTIYQKPRLRDFYDLYMIMHKYHFVFADLVKQARVKFDWSLDPLQLGTQLLQVHELRDEPRLIDPIKSDWKAYFTELAKQLKPDILQ